jgi:F0F1-type ATP synthase, alpha subunit
MADVKFWFKFEKYNSFNNVSVIIARASDSAALQYIAPFVATTLAEYFTYRGNKSLVIYDDLSKHAES